MYARQTAPVLGAISYALIAIEDWREQAGLVSYLVLGGSLHFLKR